MLFLSIILLLIFITLVIYYFFLLHQRYQYFSQRGISTPDFQYFFDHLKILWNAPSYHRQLENWTQQFGKIYGIYEGPVPVLVVSDPDFLQEVFIKQFNVFHARKVTLLDGITSDTFFSSGEKWRRQRHVVSPTFSAAKLKSMSPLINGCIGDLMKQLPEHVEKGDEFNIYLYYKRMTMDVICKYPLLRFFSSNVFNNAITAWGRSVVSGGWWRFFWERNLKQKDLSNAKNSSTLSFVIFSGRCAFGIDTDLQNNPDNIYFKKVEEFFDLNPINKNFVFKSAQVIPQIGDILARLFTVDNNVRMFLNTRILPMISSTMQLKETAVTWLLNRLDTIVKQRQQSPISRIDLLQLMLQVTTNQTIDVSNIIPISEECPTSVATRISHWSEASRFNASEVWSKSSEVR